MDGLKATAKIHCEVLLLLLKAFNHKFLEKSANMFCQFHSFMQTFVVMIWIGLEQKILFPIYKATIFRHTF